MSGVERSPAERGLIDTLRQILEIAPPVSIESEALSCADPEGARYGSWREKLREAQRKARLALQAMGEKA